MTHDYAERAARNDESRNKAENHSEAWTVDEYEFLRTQWVDKSEEELATIAEILGRTIEACRQKYYNTGSKVTMRVRTRTVTTTTETYLGLHDDKEDVWWK